MIDWWREVSRYYGHCLCSFILILMNFVVRVASDRFHGCFYSRIPNVIRCVGSFELKGTVGHFTALRAGIFGAGQCGGM